MGGMSSAFSQGMQQDQQHQQRRQQLEDEKRKGMLKMLTDDAETPADKYAAYQAVYHQDPGVLKQHVENLTRRVTGKPVQPVVKPEDAQAARLAPIAAQQKSPEQKKIADTEAEGASQRRQIAPDLDAKISAIKTTLTKYGVSPEIIENAIGAASGVPYKKPSSDELARQDYQSAMLSGQVPKDAQGTPLSFEAWKTAQSNAGRNNGAPPKAPVTKTMLIKGKSHIVAWNPETKQFDRDMGEAPPNYAQVAIPLADARAKASAKYGVTPVYDEATGSESLDTRLNVVNDINAGNAPRPGVLGAPTGQEKTRQDFAQSGLLQINTLRDIIKRNKGLFGPGAGRAQDLAAWIGSSSPDAQKARTAMLILADHSAGVFGGRSVTTVDELKDTITSMHMNPDALLAGLDQDEKTFNSLSGASGRLPAPRAAQGSAPPPPAAKGRATPAQGGAKKKWSKSAWAKANPGKDADAAAKQAQAQYEVTP